MAAAVTEANLMADEDLASAEDVTVRAAARWTGDRVRRLHQLAQHNVILWPWRQTKHDVVLFDDYWTPRWVSGVDSAGPL